MVFSKDHQIKCLGRLLSVNHALTAELERLKLIAPAELMNKDNSPYKEILFDFRYFENKDSFEKQINDNLELKQLESSLMSKHGTFIDDFSKLVSSICDSLADISEYTHRYTAVESFVESDLMEVHLLRAEMIYTFGLLWILLDSLFSPQSRESIFVAHYRLSRTTSASHFETSISLLRTRKDSIESCFSNIGINSKFVENVLQFIKTCSFVQHTEFTISPKKQAAMVYICLWFLPQTLNDQFSSLRQLVDNYFAHHWMITLHPGITVNLFDKWKTFKAANNTLNALITSEKATKIMHEKINVLKKSKFPSGLLSLNTFESYSNTISECNEALHWLIGHTSNSETVKNSRFSTVHVLSIDIDLFNYVLLLSRFEFKMKQSALYIIHNVETEANKLISKIANSLSQLTLILGSSDIVNLEVNKRIVHWITVMKKKVEGLQMDSDSNAKIIESLRMKIEEMIDLHSTDQPVLEQYLRILVKDLLSLRNVFWLNSKFLDSIDVKCDPAYLWSYLDEWTPKLEALLQSDPLQLKYLFFKLAAAVPVLIRSLKDEEERSKLSLFYHEKLSLDLKKVVQAVPRSLFAEMNELQTLLLDEQGCIVEKSLIKHLSQTERRRKLAMKTCHISQLALGITNMAMNHLGPIKISPNEMLHHGLERELYLNLEGLLKITCTQEKVVTALKKLENDLFLFKNTFLFICHQIGINGIKVWQKQLTKATSSQLDEVVEIQNKKPNTFVLHQFVTTLLQKTDPKSTSYVSVSGEWWNQNKNKMEYSANMLLCANKYLPEFVLTALRRNLISKTEKLIQESTNILIKHQEVISFEDLSTFNVDSFTKLPQFNEVYQKLLPIILKVGQFKLITNALEDVVTEKVNSESELLRKSTKSTLDYFKLSGEPMASDFIDEFKFLKQKCGFEELNKETTSLPNSNKKKLSFLLLSVLCHSLSTNVISSRKQDYVDSYPLLEGITQIIQSLGLHNIVTNGFNLVCGDSASLTVLKQFNMDNIMEPFKSIPEALKR